MRRPPPVASLGIAIARSATTASAIPAQARWTLLLAAIGAWTAAVPYVAKAIGLGVDVAARVEVVDHVVPGIVVAVVAGRLSVLARRRPVFGTTAGVIGGGICFLAGFWVTATHVPLLADAAAGRESWGSALWHASTALPIIVISLWCVLGSNHSLTGSA